MNTLKAPHTITPPLLTTCSAAEAAMRHRCEQQARRGTLTDLLCALSAYEALQTLLIVPHGAAHAMRKQCLGIYHQRTTTEA